MAGQGVRAEQVAAEALEELGEARVVEARAEDVAERPSQVARGHRAVNRTLEGRSGEDAAGVEHDRRDGRPPGGMAEGADAAHVEVAPVGGPVGGGEAEPDGGGGGRGWPGCGPPRPP